MLPYHQHASSRPQKNHRCYDGAGSSVNSGCAFKNAATWFSFSCGKSEHVAYTKRPPGFTRPHAFSKISCCTAISSSRLGPIVRQRISGLRRHVPVPLHGTSVRTISNIGELCLFVTAATAL